MAVTRLQSSHGGRISPTDLANAEAIDNAFMAANPDWWTLSDAHRTAIFCRQPVHLMIGAFRGLMAVNDRVKQLDDRACRELALYRTHHREALRTLRGAA